MMCFEEWSNSILSNCGRYDSTPTRKGRNSVGEFRIRRRHGVDIAEMRCETGRIDRIDRTPAGIRRDDSEHLFLLIQKHEETGVVHNGREEVMGPGDCMLLDSTRTAELMFEGRNVVFASVHLPRALCLEGRADAPETGRRIGASHPLRASLLNLLAEDGADETPADYLFDFVALMFRAAAPTRDAGRFRDRDGRYRYICDTLERHMSDPEFSLERLAELVHMSRRQLQRDFHDNGATFTRLLCERRIKLAASHLQRAARTRRRLAITDVAYRAGFNDLSHFNRGFRRLYDTSPRGYYADCAGT